MSISTTGTSVPGQNVVSGEATGAAVALWKLGCIYPRTLGELRNDGFRVMGWFKSPKHHNTDDGVQMSPSDILDLTKYEYQIKTLEVVNEAAETSMATPTKEEKDESTELSLALSFNKDEGQISGLG